MNIYMCKFLFKLMVILANRFHFIQISDFLDPPLWQMEVAPGTLGAA